MTNSTITTSRKRIAVVGAAGYSGVELLALLLNHPGVEVVALFGSDKGAAQPNAAPAAIFSDQHPRFRGLLDIAVQPATPAAILAANPDAVFLCTPHAASHDLAPHILAQGVPVFDLSAAFRLRDAALYPKHYAFEHTNPAHLEKAVYALPELHREAIKRADLHAIPGCYPTSAILPLAPLVKAGAIDPSRRVVIDSISGVSGAGRAANVATLFCEVSVRPYEVFKHRHTPEIEAYSGAKVWFTPQVGPYDRGIVSNIHADLAPGWDAQRARATLESAYATEPFIRILKTGTWPSVLGVVRTNFCDIALDTRENADGTHHLILVSAIDNLIKGAAGQAVQAMNIRLGFPETTALLAASATKGAAH